MRGRRGKLSRDPEPAELDGSAVVSAREQHAVRSNIAMNDIILMAVTKRLQYLTHVMTAIHKYHFYYYTYDIRNVKIVY